MLRAVLFDLDDTLVDQHSAAVEAVLAWAAERGITEPDVSERWARVSETHYTRYQLRELTFEEQRRERVREFLDLSVSDDEADAIYSGYLTRYEAAWRLFDDAIPALRRARAAGLTVGVLTNGDETHQRFKLNLLGLADEVDLLIASSTLPAGKPAPAAFHHAINRIQTPAPETLMVGNSLENDVLGAQSAGLPAVLLDRHNAHPQAAVPRIQSLNDLDFNLPPR
ncbi:HAD family hydrolase [Kribbella sp. NBC_01245]|uniref:HAD family hydrolase n=1 Tax=Kribbella sp. NBC_01245 TaxID=2903578 RepID=UPI002E29695C|nr:HAD family hydrolase [Kribbella sp. NBC_01245]